MNTLYKLLYRFDFQAAHWDMRVAAFLFLVWLVILACAISSIRSQGFSPAQERLWIGLVVFLPLVGLLAYLPFSVRHDEMPHYFRFRSSKNRQRTATRVEVKKVPRAGEQA